MKNTLEIVLGKMDNLHTICAYTSDEVDFIEEVRNVINMDREQEVIVVTDMFGGSITNSLYELLETERFHLVAGMNCSLIMPLLTSDEEDTERVISEAIELSISTLKYCNPLKNDDSSSEYDEEF